MGNKNSSNSSQKKKLSQAEVNKLLNEQRTLYEKKCQEYLQQATRSAQAAARSALYAQAAEDALTAHKKAQEAHNAQIPARRAQNAQVDEDALTAHKSAQEAQNAQIPAKGAQNASVVTATAAQVSPRFNANPGVYKQQPEFKPQQIYLQPSTMFVQNSIQQGLSGYKSEKQRPTVITNAINPSAPNLYPNLNNATTSFPTLIVENSNKNPIVNDNVTVPRYKSEKQRPTVITNAINPSAPNLYPNLNNATTSFPTLIVENSNKNPIVNDNVTVPRPRNVTNKDRNCVTCKSLFGLQIFQCNRGHNYCDSCKEQGRSCGICRNGITIVRNNALETYITKKKVQCPHTSNGCILIINRSEMNNHAKECPFKELQCPSDCSWKGYLPQLCSHFDTMHPQQRTAKLDSEMQLRGISKNSHKNYLILIGNLNFLFHIKVSTANRKIYITVQLISTKQSASKWTYEVHIYNKRQPRRKFTFIDSCTSYFEPVANIFREGRCSVLPHGYASTFANNDVLSYKIFIHKIDKCRQRGDFDQN